MTDNGNGVLLHCHIFSNKTAVSSNSISPQKTKPSVFIFGDGMIKKIDSYLLTSSVKLKFLVKTTPFLTPKTFDIHFFLYKQLHWGPSPQNYLYFQNFHGSGLLKGCLVLWPDKQILSLFQWFSSIRHRYTVYC